LNSGVGVGDKGKVVRDLLSDNEVSVSGLCGVSDDVVDESG
jgi:hypothetical protein